MKTIKIAMMALLCTGLIFSCTPSNEKYTETSETSELETQNRMAEENQQLVEELVTLRENINKKSEKISERIDNTTQTSKQELESIQKTLNAQLNRVQASLDNVNSATEENWEDIKMETQEMVAQVKTEGKDLGARIDAILEQTAKK